MNQTAELLQEDEAPTETPSEGQSPAPVAEAPKAPKPAARLCKGQMPSPLVWFIKFHESKENKSAIAAKYFTTSGKVSDIQTNANQKYIEENMTFSSEELDQAAEKIKENFVRGQEQVAAGEVVTSRQLATTTPGDEAYALSVIETIREAAIAEGAVSLEDARSAYNEANPRAPRAAKAESGDEGTQAEAVTGEDVDSINIDDMTDSELDDLLED